MIFFSIDKLQIFEGFFRCNQCVLALHLSYQTLPYNDLNFLAHNGLLQIFRRLVLE